MDTPYEIQEIEHVWIPTRDGTRLSARIWMPVNADQSPVPAILEYIPYYKRFGSTSRDEITHKYLASHGYACVRLDIRGSGESEGVLKDEYLETEIQDGIAAINWLAKQSWCTGKIGMMGISWGGFNALQIAARQPDPLKAIVSVASSDDRYADDIHHMGGTLLGDNLSWASVMFSYNTMPPDPAIVGDQWYDMWLQRLEDSGLWLKTWLQHQRRDAYWRHGSVCEDYSAIRVPVFAVSGWADGYTNTVFRLMENLNVPRKGLIGAWGHTYPHIGRPGPAIDFLSEILKWWNRWLKDEDNNVEAEPAICAWMQDSEPPTTHYEYRKGRWVTEKTWPSHNIEEKSYRLCPGRDLKPDHLAPDIESRALDLQSPITTGLMGGKWCAYANGPDLAGEQRPDDGGSLVFQTKALEEPVEILGAPYVELSIAADQPIAMVAVRLSDMRPDHQVTRVTYGLLNLTHRTSAEKPQTLEPGKKYKIKVPLNFIGQTFKKGHKIRLSISSVYWPLAWTPPKSTKLQIWTGESCLVLPVRSKNQPLDHQQNFGEPQMADPDPKTVLAPPEHNWTIHKCLKSGKTELVVIDDRGKYRLENIDLEVSARAEERYSARYGDFSSSKGVTKWHRRLKRGDWEINSYTRICLTSDPENFYIQAELDAYAGNRRIKCLSWDETIKRDHV